MDEEAEKKVLIEVANSLSKRLDLRSVVIAGARKLDNGNKVAALCMADGKAIDIFEIVTKLLTTAMDADALAEYGRMLIKMAYETKDKPETQSSNGHHGPRVRGGQ